MESKREKNCLKVNVIDADAARGRRVPVVAVKGRQLVNNIEGDDAAVVDVAQQLVQCRQKAWQAKQRVTRVATWKSNRKNF